MSKFYIVDGNSLLFRAYYATFHPGDTVMCSKDGTPTNAIFGFAKMITQIRSELQKGDRMVVCFDTGHKTFRSQENKEYKAQRKPIDPALVQQIPIAHTLLDKMSIEHAEMEGYEGDDVAGSLAKYAQSQGDDVILFTSDKDFLQLLDDHIQIHALKKGLSDIIEYTKDNVAEKFGCRADQIVDFKAIAGDPSDNYKGIPGIGEKGAFKLLMENDHLEDVIEAYKDDDKTAMGRKIRDGAEEGRLCKKIATIIIDLDVREFYEKSLVVEPNWEVLRDFYNRYDLVKLASSINSKLGKDKPANDGQMSLFEVAEKGESNNGDGNKTMPLPALTSITDIDKMNASPISISVALDGKLKEWNENVSPILGFVLMSENGALYFIRTEFVSSAKNLKQWLLSNHKGSLDSKSVKVALSRLGLDCGLFDYDFLLASYLIDSDHSSNLESALGQLGYSISTDPINRISGATLLMEQHKEEMLSKIRNSEQMPLFLEVELPLAMTLADMEIEGMPINPQILESIGDDYKKTLKNIEDQIQYYVQDPSFNPKSPNQVSDFLFKKLGLVRGKNEKGSSIEVLNNHLGDHPVVGLFIQYRMYSKIIDGYVDSLPKHIQKDGKIHAIINQTLTSTGRLSMSEPNLQNISIRKEEGKELRKAFVYDDEDYEFMSYDYSQIELRVLAAIGDIPALKEVCSSGEDIHKATAAKVFNLPIEEVTDDMRRKAKTVNFGIVYGISAFGLKERLGVSFADAKSFIEQFKKTFDGIESYQNNEVECARSKGYVTTILNRRRYFPDINSPTQAIKKFSERAAVNAAIQGSAADLIKVAMNKVAEAIKGMKSKLVLQIHDELVFKVYKPEEKKLMELVPQIMDGALKDKLDVRLQVEGDIGHSWYDCK